MNEIKLTTDLVNAIMQYLGNQKFVDVAGLINEIQKQANAQGAQPAAQTQPADPTTAPTTN